MTNTQRTIRSTVILKVTLSTAVANIRQITDVARDNCCFTDAISLEIIKALWSNSTDVALYYLGSDLVEMSRYEKPLP